MTDELDPQTQQHIDDSADVTDDCSTPTCVAASVDASAEDAHPRRRPLGGPPGKRVGIVRIVGLSRHRRFCRA